MTRDLLGFRYSIDRVSLLTVRACDIPGATYGGVPHGVFRILTALLLSVNLVARPKSPKVVNETNTDF
jgi:hypothetical protein